MDCLPDAVEVVLEIKFKCKKDRQKYLVEFILTYSSLDLKSLAELLNISVLMLSQRAAGVTFLTATAAIRLAEIFCMLFSD